MKAWRGTLPLIALGLGLGASALVSQHLVQAAAPPLPPPAAPLYSNDFEKSPEGDVPGDMVVLTGSSFAIKSVDNNKVLELPGDPLDSYGVLFGPEGESLLAVQARIFATSTGKRNPEFGVGLGDANGYKLWMMPATGQLQIIKGEEVKITVPELWKTGSWTTMRLAARSGGDGKTVVEGKAWTAGEPEPKDWQISFTDDEEAPKGRASVWGVPYSSTPLRFDDLVVTKPGGDS